MKNAGLAWVVGEGGGWGDPSPTWTAVPGSWPVYRHREQATESWLEAGKVDRCML